MLPIPDLTPRDVDFGNIGHMPKWADLPEEFQRERGPYCKAMSHWFFDGAKRDGDKLTIDGKVFRAKEGVDARKALYAIQSVLGSFDPSHGHKIAACSYMLAEWFALEGGG